MLARHLESAPARVLMTVDAVGGVWRYALELARGLAGAGTEVVLVVMGPPAAPEQLAEAAAIHGVRVVEGSFDLEWMPGADDDVVRAGAVFREEVVGEALAVDRVQELDLHPAAAAEPERDR